MADEKLKSFHFDCGNSNEGPVGFCGRIKAKNRREALRIMRRVLPTEVKVRPIGDDEDNGRVEYIEAYFNEKRVTISDVDEGE
jgi:hypothetical protein